MFTCIHIEKEVPVKELLEVMSEVFFGEKGAIILWEDIMAGIKDSHTFIEYQEQPGDFSIYLQITSSRFAKDEELHPYISRLCALLQCRIFMDDQEYYGTIFYPDQSVKRAKFDIEVLSEEDERQYLVIEEVYEVGTREYIRSKGIIHPCIYINRKMKQEYIFKALATAFEMGIDYFGRNGTDEPDDTPKLFVSYIAHTKGFPIEISFLHTFISAHGLYASLQKLADTIDAKVFIGERYNEGHLFSPGDPVAIAGYHQKLRCHKDGKYENYLILSTDGK